MLSPVLPGHSQVWWNPYSWWNYCCHFCIHAHCTAARMGHRYCHLRFERPSLSPVSCPREASGKEGREKLWPPRAQEADLLHRRHEHAGGGCLRDGAAPHPHQAAPGLRPLVGAHRGPGWGEGTRAGPSQPPPLELHPLRLALQPEEKPMANSLPHGVLLPEWALRQGVTTHVRRSY